MRTYSVLSVHPVRPKGDRTVGHVGIRIELLNFPRRYQGHAKYIRQPCPTPPCLTMPCNYAIEKIQQMTHGRKYTFRQLSLPHSPTPLSTLSCHVALQLAASSLHVSPTAYTSTSFPTAGNAFIIFAGLLFFALSLHVCFFFVAFGPFFFLSFGGALTHFHFISAFCHFLI